MTNRTSPKAIASRTVVRRHPVRGAFWGAVLGSGLALHLLGFGIVAFGSWPLLTAPVAITLVLGLVWGVFGPARKVQGHLPPERRVAATASNGRRSAAEARASQILAARQVNEELHDIAATPDDGPMQAALHEAENDVVKVARPQSSRHAERLEPVAATPAELFTDTQPSSAAATDVDLSSAEPLVDDPARAAVMSEAELVSESVLSSPLSLSDESEAVESRCEVPHEVEAPVAPLADDTAPAVAIEEPVPDVPLSLTAEPEREASATEESQHNPPLSLTASPAPALTTPVPPLPDNPANDAACQSTPEPAAEQTAAPLTPVAPVDSNVAAPPATIAQDLTPFENSPLPNGADEERLAADKLDAQLDAALREAWRVTTGTS